MHVTYPVTFALLRYFNFLSSCSTCSTGNRHSVAQLSVGYCSQTELNGRNSGKLVTKLSFFLWAKHVPQSNSPKITRQVQW